MCILFTRSTFNLFSIFCRSTFFSYSFSCSLYTYLLFVSHRGRPNWIKPKLQAEKNRRPRWWEKKAHTQTSRPHTKTHFRLTNLTTSRNKRFAIVYFDWNVSIFPDIFLLLILRCTIFNEVFWWRARTWWFESLQEKHVNWHRIHKPSWYNIQSATAIERFIFFFLNRVQWWIECSNFLSGKSLQFNEKQTNRKQHKE